MTRRAWLIVLLLGCESAPVDHHLFVEVRSDLVIGEEVSRIEVTVDGETFETALEPTDRLSEGLRVLEVRLAPGPYAGELRVLDEAGQLVVQPRPFEVELSSARVLSFLVSRRCRDMDCPEGTACFGRDCAPIGCVSGGEEQCITSPECAVDADCDPRIACSNVTCTEHGQCLWLPADELCDAGSRCVLDEGCVPIDGCDENSCASDLCASATCEGQRCVRVSTVDCDDSDPCTADSCDPVDGCVHTPVSGVSCADELFCNGEEMCVDGVCAPSAAGACTMGCDEVRDTCTACAVDADCGPPRDLEVFDCAYADDCVETGQRDVTQGVPRCQMGMCTMERRRVQRPCSRVSEDLPCGTNPPDGTPECTPPAGAPCSATGTASFERTVNRCAAGVCTPNTFTVTGGTCSTMIQDGDTCGLDQLCCGESCRPVRFDPRNCNFCGVACDWPTFTCLGRAPSGGGVPGHCECATSADCPNANWNCVNGRCQCQSDAACVAGQRCVSRQNLMVCD